MDIARLAVIVTENPEVATLLLDLEEHSDTDWLEFALSGDSHTYSAVQETLYELIPHSEEIEFKVGQEFTYSSIVSDEEKPGSVLVCLAPDKIVISEFEDKVSIVNETEAQEFFTEYNVGKPVMVNIIGGITKEDFLNKLKKKYIELIKKIVNEPEDVRRILDQDDYDGYLGDDNDTIVVNLLSRSKNRYDEMLSKLQPLIEDC